MVHIDPVLGLVAPELNWVPTPSHIIRRAAVLDLLEDLAPGRTLEMGCGSGAFLHDLAQRGCHGKGVDSSEHAWALAQRLGSGEQGGFTIAKNLTDDDVGAYDYLMAFEVLEHVEDDGAALREWAQCLKSEGTLIISVPAHRRLWGAADEWAGHCRRYDYSDVVRLLSSAGFTATAIRCYGFPLLNILSPLSNFASRRKLAARGRAEGIRSPSEATARSGSDRRLEAKLFRLYANALSKLAFAIGFRLQRTFYNTSFGTGFLVLAKRVDAGR